MHKYAIGRLHKLPLVLQEDFSIPGSFAFAGEKIFPGLHGDVQLRGGGRGCSEALWAILWKGGFVMRKTENYNLSQWELSDEIKMEDFNQDNAAVDAALAALAAIAGRGDHIHVISKGNPNPNGGYTLLYNLDKQVNWSDYWMVAYFQIVRPLPSYPDAKVFFNTNITSHEVPFGLHMVIFFPMYNADKVPFHFLLLGDNMIKFVTDTGYDRPIGFMKQIRTEAVPDSAHYNSGGYMLLGFK